VINSERSPFVRTSAGTARVRIVSVPALCWVSRCSQIRDFLLLYRDLATTDQNLWAEAHLDGLLEKVGQLEQRAKLQVRVESPRVFANYVGDLCFPELKNGRVES